MKKEKLLLKSSEPLKDEIIKFKKMYWFTILFFVMGALFDDIFLLIAPIYFGICFIVEFRIAEWKCFSLRDIKFKFIPNVTNDDIFSKIQSELLSKYGNTFTVERDSDGIVTISYAGLIYSIVLEEDYFRLYWYASTVKRVLLFFVQNDMIWPKRYKEMRIAMGIIAYEIQKAFEIN